MTLRIALLCTILLAICHAEEPVFIDDAKIEQAFVDQLSALVQKEDTLTMPEAESAIEKNTSRKVSISKTPVKPSPEAPASLYGKCAPSVVFISSIYKCGKCEDSHLGASGTGWIADSSGIIVTNAHLFTETKNDPIGVMTIDGGVFPVKQILAADTAKDIAILRIDPGNKTLPALPLAETASPGEEVSVISHPQGRHYCLTNGRISRYHRETNEETRQTNDWLSITADFALGSSGGPVLNNKGEVVGMVASTLTAYAENSGCKALPERDVQMVFKDCVPLNSLRAMFQPRD
jgi:S1-C subfamily serine protease